jgi:magnesium chelatase family protein
MSESLRDSRIPCNPVLPSERGSRRYRTRVSGPLLDGIDLQIEVPAVAFRELASDTPAESSAAIRARVEAARD